jgi:hypothetical protein
MASLKKNALAAGLGCTFKILCHILTFNYTLLSFLGFGKLRAHIFFTEQW